MCSILSSISWGARFWLCDHRILALRKPMGNIMCSTLREANGQESDCHINAWRFQIISMLFLEFRIIILLTIYLCLADGSFQSEIPIVLNCLYSPVVEIMKPSPCVAFFLPLSGNKRYVYLLKHWGLHNKAIICRRHFPIYFLEWKL